MRVDPNLVVLTWNGGKLTYGELYKKKEAEFRKIRNKYVNDLYAAEQKELEGFVVQQLVEKAAKDANKSPDEYIQGIASSAGSPTDAELQKFYDDNVKQSGQPFDSIKDRIKGFLENQKKQDKVRAEFERLKTEAQVKISLPEPAGATFELAGRPMKGNPNAKVTIVEFSDFECPYCSKAIPKVEEILAAYPNDVKFYFLHYPLSFHKSAMPAASASYCAHQQQKFWPMHDKLFGNQASLSGPDFFKATAKELGLDEAKFTACMDDPKTAEFVKADQQQGDAAGVEGTPSFFINGTPYAQGVPTVDALKPYVQRVN